MARSISDRRAEADALNNLGVLCSRNGDHTKASTFDTQALAIRREIKDLPGEINSLHNLAEVSRDAGDLVHAQELYLECLSKLDITGDQEGADQHAGRAYICVQPAGRSRHSRCLRYARPGSRAAFWVPHRSPQRDLFCCIHRTRL
ncbi:MAG: tetratricopeptide repeat protein [Flavobacteriales bacterium]|nr:tetratricopeptide repeat protein [Flavobacteriales bacterium]